MRYQDLGYNLEKKLIKSAKKICLKHNLNIEDYDFNMKNFLSNSENLFLKRLYENDLVMFYEVLDEIRLINIKNKSRKDSGNDVKKSKEYVHNLLLIIEDVIESNLKETNLKFIKGIFEIDFNSKYNLLNNLLVLDRLDIFERLFSKSNFNNLINLENKSDIFNDFFKNTINVLHHTKYKQSNEERTIFIKSCFEHKIVNEKDLDFLMNVWSICLEKTIKELKVNNNYSISLKDTDSLNMEQEKLMKFLINDSYTKSEIDKDYSLVLKNNIETINNIFNKFRINKIDFFDLNFYSVKSNRLIFNLSEWKLKTFGENVFINNIFDMLNDELLKNKTNLVSGIKLMVKDKKEMIIEYTMNNQLSDEEKKLTMKFIYDSVITEMKKYYEDYLFTSSKFIFGARDIIKDNNHVDEIVNNIRELELNILLSKNNKKENRGNVKIKI